MSRFPIWIVNGTLFVLCCFLTSSLVTGWVGEWIAGPPATPALAPAAVPVSGRDWSQREGILTRNLFQVSTLLPQGPSTMEPGGEAEDLEATRLPLEIARHRGVDQPPGFLGGRRGHDPARAPGGARAGFPAR